MYYEPVSSHRGVEFQRHVEFRATRALSFVRQRLLRTDKPPRTDLLEPSPHSLGSPGAQTVKRLPALRETWVQPLGREDLLEKQMATHASALAWIIPWAEEPGGLQSVGSQRVGQDGATSFLYNSPPSHLTSLRPSSGRLPNPPSPQHRLQPLPTRRGLSPLSAGGFAGPPSAWVPSPLPRASPSPRRCPGPRGLGSAPAPDSNAPLLGPLCQLETEFCRKGREGEKDLGGKIVFLVYGVSWCYKF